MSDEATPPSKRADLVPPIPACPVCGGRLIEIRAKLQCSLVADYSRTVPDFSSIMRK